jgi:hypothetical protein
MRKVGGIAETAPIRDFGYAAGWIQQAAFRQFNSLEHHIPLESHARHSFEHTAQMPG